jgi:hypothetical protein
VREGYGTADQAWNWPLNPSSDYEGSYAINGWLYWATTESAEARDPAKTFAANLR